MRTTCFGLYLGHSCNCKYLSKEDTLKFWGAPCLQSPFFYFMSLFKSFVLTCLKMAYVKAETCSKHVKVTIWIKINLFCVRLNVVCWAYTLLFYCSEIHCISILPSMQIMRVFSFLQVLLGAFTKLRKATINFVISVRQSVHPSVSLSVRMGQLGSH